MTKSLQKILLAGLMAGFLCSPVLAAESLNQGEAFFRAGQDALRHDQWYLALTLWEDIPMDSQIYPNVRSQFQRLRAHISSRGASYQQLLAAKALEQADREARQGYWVAALYFLGKIPPDTAQATPAARRADNWRQQLASAGLQYESELSRHTQDYQAALQNWEQDNYYESLRRLQSIQPDSPYFHRARALLSYARNQLANLPQDIRYDTQPNQPVYRPQKASRSFAIGLQGRMGLPLDNAAAGGGGLGLSWYLHPQAALHLEVNVFPINGSMVSFVPLTGRFVLPVDPSWDLFVGAGGFWSAGSNVNVLGLLGEVGTTWQVNPHWALELSGDYGIPMSTPGTQTLGGRLGIMTTF